MREYLIGCEQHTGDRAYCCERWLDSSDIVKALLQSFRTSRRPGSPISCARQALGPHK